MTENFIRKNTFTVEIDGIETSSFNKATIGGSETSVLEYYEGGRNKPYKDDGKTTFNDIVLSKAISGDNEMFDWRQSVIDGDDGAKRDIAIVARDKQGNEKARWNVKEAWPSAISDIELDADSEDEYAMYEMTITFEDIKKV